MGFTKLDENILKSSIMAEDPAVFKVWIALLAACKQDGIADVSPIFLSSVCRLDIETVNKALERLSSPDPCSRSLAEEGARIKKVDGGFQIINYLKYREKSLRDIEAERKRRQREKEKEKEKTDCPGQSGNVQDSPGQSGTVPGPSASASASSSSSSSKYKEKNKEDLKEDLKEDFEEFWNIYDYKVAKEDAFNAYKALRRKGVGKEEIIAAVKGYYNYLKIKKVYENFEQSRMYPATFLRKNRWKDYIGIEYKPRL